MDDKSTHARSFGSKRMVIKSLAILMSLSLNETYAQFSYKWLAVGSMQSPYSSGGALREQEPFDNAPIQYPAIDHRGGNVRACGFWVGATNFTDETGRFFPYKIAHIGPGSGNAMQFFPTIAELRARFEVQVLVDSAQSFLRPVFIDTLDPNLKADRMVHVVNNNLLGIEMDMKAYAFSQEFHDAYHIIEYTFTNTGNVDADSDIELSQTLQGVYFFFINRYALHEGASWITGNGAPWGKFTMNDAVGDGHEDYGVDFRAQYSWFGYSVSQTDFNSLGGPMWRELTPYSAPLPDTSGRLAAAHMVGRLYLHTDKSASDESDDPLQPATMGVKGGDEPDMLNDSEEDIALMQRQYQNFMQLGRQYPHHAQLVEPTREYDKPRNDPASAFGRYVESGWAAVEGFGPYTIQPGDNIRIVVAEGASGLSDAAKLAIGQAYKRAGSNRDNALIYFGGRQLTKNQWVLTSKDSLFQMFERALANYRSDLNIPQPPLPPSKFMITSRSNRITLEWETFPGQIPTGWEAYRKSGQWQDAYAYQLIAVLPGDWRSYDDQAVQRGLAYYYYIQAVGEVNNDPTGNTPTGVRLKSGRYYTQTYLPAKLVPPISVENNRQNLPTTFALMQNFPNPFNPETEIGYQLDKESEVILKIFNPSGQTIRTFNQGMKKAGTYAIRWDGNNHKGMRVPSGVYFYQMIAKRNGSFRAEVRKMVLLE
ncbi:MAG: FlgD immunoglobulin-like domain containing protein [bacterium]